MKKQLEQLLEWHKAFGVPYKESIEVPDYKRQLLRVDLLSEELHEFLQELRIEPERVNIENVSKELCDIAYVLFGTVVEFGLQDEFEKCFDEVHRSNMSKLGNDGKPIYREDGKVLKGENYSPANLSFLKIG